MTIYLSDREYEQTSVECIRVLDNNEVRLVSACFNATFEARNRGLFMLGVSTGGRISELLSLQIGDVYQSGKPVTDLLFDKSIVKGGEVFRAVPVNSDGRRAIEDLIGWHGERYQNTDKSRPLFPSRNGQGAKRMSRRTAHDVLKSAFEAAGLKGKLSQNHKEQPMFGEYEHEGMPFTKKIAEELIFKLYKGTSPVNENDIQEQVYQAHKNKRGLPPEVQKRDSDSPSDIEDRISYTIRVRIRSALRNLEHKGCATKKEPYIWCIHEIDIHRDEQTYPKTLGVGSQEVYLYYYPTYKENVIRKKMNHVWEIYQSEILWECKIGETHDQDTETRVKQQMGGHPEKPIIALIIKTNDSKRLEKMIHDILKFRNRQIPDAQGDEWFITSPDEVEYIYDFLQSI